jgi:hypothetical protein
MAFGDYNNRDYYCLILADNFMKPCLIKSEFVCKIPSARMSAFG